MYGLRKRKREESSSEADGLQKLLDAAARCSKVVVFSGSGLSASSGMSTFSTKGGLYEKAQKKFGVQDGKKLFTYTFYERRKVETLAFFADIYSEAAKADAGPGHRAIAAIAQYGRLQRHYTLNIDGLADAVGLDVWHPETNPSGATVEMHGSIKQLVCPECGTVTPVTELLLRRIRQKRRVRCPARGCPAEGLRWRIMLYDDAEGELITPEDLFDTMEADVLAADLILWVGISFQQSASVEYFRRVRAFLLQHDRLRDTLQALVNVSDEALWNVTSACSNTDDLQLLEVLGSSDEVLPKVAAALVDYRAAVPAPSPPLAAPPGPGGVLQLGAPGPAACTPSTAAGGAVQPSVPAAAASQHAAAASGPGRPGCGASPPAAAATEACSAVSSPAALLVPAQQHRAGSEARRGDGSSSPVDDASRQPGGDEPPEADASAALSAVCITSQPDGEAGAPRAAQPKPAEASGKLVAAATRLADAVSTSPGLQGQATEPVEPAPQHGTEGGMAPKQRQAVQHAAGPCQTESVSLAGGGPDANVPSGGVLPPAGGGLARPAQALEMSAASAYRICGAQCNCESELKLPGTHAPPFVAQQPEAAEKRSVAGTSQVVV